MTEELIQRPDTDARASFFRACAEIQDPENQEEQEQRGIFNNSDRHYVSDALKWQRDHWQVLLRRYLSVKFAFLAAVAAGTPPTREQIAARLEVDATTRSADEALSFIESVWTRTSELETRALLLRLEQLPAEVVVAQWYYDCDDYRAWVEAAQRQAEQLAAERWCDDYGSSYAALLADGSHAAIPYQQAVARRLHAPAAQILMGLYAHLSGEGILAPLMALRWQSDRFAVEMELAPANRSWLALGGVRGAVAGVATSLLDDVLDHGVIGLAGETLLERFTVSVARVVGCDYCDFLHWDGEELTPIVNSKPRGDLAHLMSIPYRSGEGISGSVILLPERATRRWVGTNLFGYDPRASVRHVRPYVKELEEDIRDYWVFPVFASGELFGAFRVVNRSPERYRAGVPWSEVMLYEMHALAIWFERFLLPRVSARGGIEGIMPHRADTGHSAVVHELRYACGLDWVVDTFLASLVSHVCSVAFRKVEKASLGCCIGVFDSESVPAIGARLDRYKAIKAEDEASTLADASRLYSRVDPRGGMFVFDSHGRGAGVVSLSHRELGSGIDCAKALTKEPSPGVVMLLEREQDCLRVITDGEIAADYFMSEASGEWTLRVYSTLLEILRQSRPDGFEPWLVDEVFRLAAELSYRKIGSMIVLCDPIPPSVRLIGGELRKGLYLSTISTNEFADLARIDGAIIVNRQHLITHCGVFIRPNMPLHEDDVALPGAGSRHRAGRDFSRLAPDALVLVISENRPITAYRAGKAVFSRH